MTEYNKAKNAYEMVMKKLYEMLKNIETEENFDSFTKYLDELQDNGIVKNDEGYELYNEAFEKLYGHPAFDEEGNFYE